MQIQVADVLNLALDSIENDSIQNDALKNVYKGIKMTQDVLLKNFSKHGLLPINPTGQKFDPNLHEAVYEIPIDQVNLYF